MTAIPISPIMASSENAMGVFNDRLEDTMFEIHDCYGAPQCGYDVIVVDTWEEVEEYFCYDDDAAERLEMGYADWIEL